jgi:hypothetical protein
MAEDKSTRAVAVAKPLDLRMNLQATKKMANELKEFIDQNSLSMVISNKNYALVEAWEFAGAQLGLVAIITDCQDVSKDLNTSGDRALIRYKATCEVVHMATGQVVSRGKSWDKPLSWSTGGCLLSQKLKATTR